jgi:4-phytase/acid phosphatase
MPAPVFSDEEQRTLEHELAAIRSREAEQLTLLAQLLGPSVNAADTLHFPEKGSHQLVTLKGGLKTAASASEVLLLEALQWPARAQRIPVAERLPKDGHRLSAVEIKTRQILSAPFAKRPDVRVHTPAPVWKDIPIPPNGPLMVNPRTALELLSVHSAVQNVLKKTPPSARASGLPLLIFMAEALTGTSPVKAANEATLVLLAGHDSNIAAVSALLDLHWAGRDFPPDSSPPGSMLALSLWETPQGRVVQASFLRQSLAALFSTDSTAMDSAALVHERLLLPSAAAWTPSGPGLPLAAFLSLVDTLAEGSDVKTNLPYATAPSTVPAD